MIVRRIFKTLISEDEEGQEFEINIVRKAIEIADVMSVEECDIFEDCGYETLYLLMKNGTEFFILGNFDTFYKKWQESRKFNIFANNN